MEEKKEMSQDQKDELIKKELEEAEILEKKLASERRDEVSRMVADLEKENSDREDQENKETEEPDREKKAEEMEISGKYPPPGWKGFCMWTRSFLRIIFMDMSLN